MPQSNIKLLVNYASYFSAKNRVIASNIANVGTKDYKRLDVKFKDVFNENLTLKTTEEFHITKNKSVNNQSFEIIKDSRSENVSGINNVDIDNEMAELAANNLIYKFTTKKIKGYFQMMQAVIRGGGGA